MADQAGVNLTPCTRWLRVLEVHYRRPSKVGGSVATLPSTPSSGGSGGYGLAPDLLTQPRANEVAVYFVCDVEACLPSPEAWPGVYAEQKRWRRWKAEQEAPALPPPPPAAAAAVLPAIPPTTELMQEQVTLTRPALQSPQRLGSRDEGVKGLNPKPIDLGMKGPSRRDRTTTLSLAEERTLIDFRHLIPSSLSTPRRRRGRSRTR